MPLSSSERSSSVAIARHTFCFRRCGSAQTVFHGQQYRRTAMDGNANNVLLIISNDPTAAATIGAALAESADDPYATIWVHDLATGLARLGEGDIGAVLLDPFLPDCQGIATFDQFFVAAPRVPILILTSRDKER